MTDSAELRRFARWRRLAPVGHAVTLLEIGAGASKLVSAPVGAVPRVFLLPLGSDAVGRGPFRHDPPTPLEVEAAIESIEDVVMPLARQLASPATLIATGDALAAIVRAAAPPAGPATEGAARGISDGIVDDATDDALGSVLTTEAVERLFQRFAAVVQGRPPASSGLPAGPGFAATLLILREILHHLDFAAVTVVDDAQ